MTRSKLVEANQKIAVSVTSKFQKMSNNVVGQYTKIEDKFVDKYLKQDNETISSAKERLKKEQAKRKAAKIVSQ